MEEDNLTKLKAIQQDYIKLFSSEEGKRVMADMENTGFFNTSTFVKNDELSMAFNEGLRSFLLHIKTIIKMDIAALEKIAALNQKQ